MLLKVLGILITFSLMYNMKNQNSLQYMEWTACILCVKKQKNNINKNRINYVDRKRTYD